MSPILRVRLPEEVELHARRTLDGCVEFTYTERAVHTESLKVATEEFKRAFEEQGVKIEQPDEHSLTMSGTVKRRHFGDLMASEFLNWSSMVDLTIGELLGNVVRIVAADANKKAEKLAPLPDPVPAPVHQPAPPPPLEQRVDPNDPERCVGYVVNEGDTHLFQCCNTGTYRDDGYYWCHDCHAKRPQSCQS